MLRLRIILLLCLVAGALTQDFFDLSDVLDDVKPATLKPPEQPKAPEKPKPKDDGDFGLDLEDALGPDPPKPAKPTVKPPKSGGGDFGLDLEDVLGPDSFDLSDTRDDVKPATLKPPEQPKAPEKPKPIDDGDFGLDLEDALGPAQHPLFHPLEESARDLPTRN